MPSTFRFEDKPVQALSVISNVPYFVTLYTAWAILLFLLVFSRNASPGPNWEDLILVNLTILVLIDYWVIATGHLGFLPDFEVGGVAYVDFIRVHGKIDPSHFNFGYFEYPVLSILGAVLSETANIDTLYSRTIILIWNSFFFASILYLFFLRFLKIAPLAVLATAIVLLGNAAIKGAITFHPAAFGIILFTAFLSSLPRYAASQRDSIGNRGIFVIPLVVTAVHLVTSLAISAVLITLYLTQKLTSKRFVDRRVVSLFLIVPLAWLFYVAEHTQLSIVALLKLAMNDFGSIWFLRNVAKTFAGAEVPLWVRTLRISWLVFIFAPAGTGLVLSLTRIRELTNEEAEATAAFIGIAIYSGILVLMSPGGHQYYRFLYLGGLPAVLFTLKLLIEPRFSLPWLHRILVAMLIVLFVPTLLAHNPNVETSAWYPQEVSASRFLRTTYGDGTRLTLFADSDTAYLFLAQMPETTYIRINETGLIRSKEALIDDIGNLVDLFQRGREPRPGVFVNSPRFSFRFGQLLGIKLTDSVWTDLKATLSQTNKIYDNAFSTVYY
jgi:hypothetical protein